MKKLVSVLLCLVMLLSVLPMGAITVSASTEFYGYTPISSVDDLNAVRNNLKGYYYLTKDISFKSSDFAAGGKYYNGGAGWQPIGSKYFPFTGVFDGNGHTISGLYININDTTGNNVYAGLFGNCDEGTIRNLGMLNSSITAGGVGAIYVGGIVGYTPYESYATIENCYNTGVVNGIGNGEYETFVGGIAGRICNTTIINCYNTGEVLGHGTSVSVGGVAGSTVGSSTVKNSYNLGVVSADEVQYASAGGVVGDAQEDSYIYICSNSGDVDATGESGAFAGGVVGIIDASRVSVCSNSASIMAFSTRESGLCVAGGIVGYGADDIIDDDAYAAIDWSYNIGLVSSISMGYKGSSVAGGIMGQANSAMVLVSYNVGSVIANGDSVEAAGGIAGYTNYIVSECYNLGNVRSFNGFYSRGIASLTTDESWIHNCYYLNTCCANGDTYGLSRTAAQMATSGTYAGFNFEKYWTMGGNSRYQYPELKGMEMDDLLSVSAANAKNGVTVSWDPAFSADKYVVYRSYYSNGKWSNWAKYKTTTATSWTDTSAKNGVYYQYLVQAVNGGAVIFDKDVAICHLTTPTVTATNAKTGVTVKWTKNAKASQYYVYRSYYSGGKWSSWTKFKTTTATTWTDTSAKAGVKYRYMVRSVKDGYVSVATTGDIITRLTNPTVKATNATSGVKVTWDKVKGASSYAVYRSYYSSSTGWSKWTRFKTVTGTSWTDTTAKNGIKYRYMVRAVKDDDLSVAATGDTLRRLTTSTVKTAKASSGIKVSWTKNSYAKKYYVYRSTYSNGKWSDWSKFKTTTSASWTDTTVKKGKTYRYMVRTVNGDDISYYKASSSIKR